MKLNIQLLATIILTVSMLNNAQSQSRVPLSITGTIKNIPDGTTIYLIENKIILQDTIAKTECKQENFKFMEDLYGNGGMYFIKMDTTVTKLAPEKNTWLRILTNQENIFIKSSIQNWPSADIQGNNQDEEYIRIVNEFISIEKYYKPKIWDAKDSIQQYGIKKELEDSAYKFLVKNGDYYGTAWLAFQIYDIISNQRLSDLYNILPQNIKLSYPGIRLKNEINLRNAMVGIRQNAILPDFVIQDTTGKNINIHQLTNNSKVTLIDFWASWCVPCQAAFPKLKNLHSKYKSEGFNIISISSDKSQDKWLKAVRDSRLPWPQTIESKTLAVSSDIFGIETIPTYLLVGQNGRMIALTRGKGKIDSFGPDLLSSELENVIIDALKNNL